MWFIGLEVEQETSAPPAKKKILDPPLLRPFCSFPVSFICASPNALYLSVHVFSTFYVFIRATQRSSRL